MSRLTLYHWQYRTCIQIFEYLCTSFVVADHEHDCNELQVTPGFRTHVAAKLGRLLEGYVQLDCGGTFLTQWSPDTVSKRCTCFNTVSVSSIAETYTENVSCVEPKRCDNDDDDDEEEGEVSLSLFWYLLLLLELHYLVRTSNYFFDGFFRISSVFYVRTGTGSQWSSSPCEASARSQLKVFHYLVFKEPH